MPLKPNLLPKFIIFRLFLQICVQFQTFKNLYPAKNQKKWEIMKKVLVSEKKISSNTKIRPWFLFPIPKPGFGRTLQWDAGKCDFSFSVWQNSHRSQFCKALIDVSFVKKSLNFPSFFDAKKIDFNQNLKATIYNGLYQAKSLDKYTFIRLLKVYRWSLHTYYVSVFLF